MVAGILRTSYARLGAFLLPGSFTRGRPGGDIHYSGTMPMRETPSLGQSDPNGEVFGLKHFHIIDGASLPLLSEKPHTLTIMANADRIARVIAHKLGGKVSGDL
jgi:choline dehydrogenase-like flavoprotein